MAQSYTIQQTPVLSELLKKTEGLKAEIECYRPFAEDIWETIQEKLRLDWTYNSNAIEGNTLTRGETAFFLKEGLTVQGKPLKYFLEAKNHHEAIGFCLK